MEEKNEKEKTYTGKDSTTLNLISFHLGLEGRPLPVALTWRPRGASRGPLQRHLGGPTRGYPCARGARRRGRGGHPAPLRRPVALRRRPGQGPRASPARRRAYGHVPAAGDSQAGLGRGPRRGSCTRWPAAGAAVGMEDGRQAGLPAPVTGGQAAPSSAPLPQGRWRRLRRSGRRLRVHRWLRRAELVTGGGGPSAAACIRNFMQHKKQG